MGLSTDSPRASYITRRHSLASRQCLARSRVSDFLDPIGTAAVFISITPRDSEARRRARFFPIGHTPGEQPEPQPVDNPEHPLTLDLRWHAH